MNVVGTDSFAVCIKCKIRRKVCCNNGQARDDKNRRKWHHHDPVCGFCCKEPGHGRWAKKATR